jgi:hypothetical protein
MIIEDGKIIDNKESWEYCKRVQKGLQDVGVSKEMRRHIYIHMMFTAKKKTMRKIIDFMMGRLR